MSGWNLSLKLIVIFIILFGFAVCNAQEKKIRYPEVKILGSEVREFHSDIIDEDYRLSISLPPGYGKGEKSYPVLYLTDSDSFFGYVKALVGSLQYSKKIPEMIIIGVGYKETGMTGWNNRKRDYLPAKSEKIPGSGGGENYRLFLEKELFPFVESNFRTDPNDRIFVGMSSGGTIGAYILSKSPEMFHRYLIVSAALHSGNEMIVEIEKEYASNHEDLSAVVYTAMGEHEPEYMHKTWNELFENIKSRNYKNCRLILETIDDGYHMDAVYCAYVRGLKAVYSEDK